MKHLQRKLKHSGIKPFQKSVPLSQRLVCNLQEPTPGGKQDSGNKHGMPKGTDAVASDVMLDVQGFAAYY